MATATDTLINQARCINSCIPDGMKPAVMIYLLAVAAGVDPTNVNSLINNAVVINSTIPPGSQASVIISLFDRLVNGP